MISPELFRRFGASCVAAAIAAALSFDCMAAIDESSPAADDAAADDAEDGAQAAAALPPDTQGRPEGPRPPGLRISNVRMAPRNANTAAITFDVSWPYSWRYGVCHDAAWVFFKARADGKSEWQHVRPAASKVLNPAGYTQEKGGTGLEFVVPDGEDGFTGVFIRRAADGIGPVSAKGVTVLCEAQPLVTDDRSPIALIRGFGIEMVYVPECPFYVGLGAEEPFPGGGYGFGGMEQNWLYRYTRADGRDFIASFYYSRTGYLDAWVVGVPDGKLPAYLVDSEGPIPTGCQDGSLWAVDIKPENKGEIPAAFPNGFAAFYCMKYPWITEGQYADFLNTLTAAQAKQRYWIEGHGAGMNGGSAVKRLGKEPDHTYAATNPDGMCPWVSWKDAVTYAAWAGLRPMTELEFEKTVRGPDFAAPNDARPSYWGVNGVQADRIFERAISIGDATGRAFKGSHGRGTLEPPPDWPATHLEGVILRGDAVPGVWQPGKFTPTHLLIAGRTYPLYADSDRSNERYPGWRGARSAPAPAGTAISGRTAADSAMSPFNPPEPQVYTLARTNRTMKPDGILDEWEKPTLVLDEPSLIQPNQMRFPSGDNPDSWRGPDDMSVKAYLGWDGEAVCVAAEVKDDAHSNTNGTDNLWDGDTMEFGLIDADANQTDLWLALAGDGVVLNPLADPTEKLAAIAKYAVARDEAAKVTRYELRLPMAGLRLKPGTECCFYLRVFDNDGGTARYRFELAPTITDPFKAALYSKIVLAE